MTFSLFRYAVVGTTFACAAFGSVAIEADAYRKISRPGLTAAEVLLIAGEPNARQREGNCATWLYRGTDRALENRLVVVSLCNNKVVSTTTKLSQQ